MTSLIVKDDPKMLRETLCVAQAVVARSTTDADRRHEHVARISRLITECDRHRPLGPDGKHGDRHTATCGCDDIPAPALAVGEEVYHVDDPIVFGKTLQVMGNNLVVVKFPSRAPETHPGSELRRVTVPTESVVRAAVSMVARGRPSLWRDMAPTARALHLSNARDIMADGLDVTEMAEHLHALHRTRREDRTCPSCEVKAGYLRGMILGELA